MLLALWNDEDGVILSAELVLITTILVLGLIVGLVEFQSAVVSELSDLGNAIGNLDQSYQTSGVASMNSYAGTNSASAGASYIDGMDYGDNNAVISGDAGMSMGENSPGFGGVGEYGTVPMFDFGSASSEAHVDANGYPVEVAPSKPPQPEVPQFTPEEVEEMERIRMERRVYEKYKVPPGQLTP